MEEEGEEGGGEEREEEGGGEEREEEGGVRMGRRREVEEGGEGTGRRRRRGKRMEEINDGSRAVQCVLIILVVTRQ